MRLPAFKNGIRVVRHFGGYRIDVFRPLNGFDVRSLDAPELEAKAAQFGITVRAVKEAA